MRHALVLAALVSVGCTRKSAEVAGAQAAGVHASQGSAARAETTAGGETPADRAAPGGEDNEAPPGLDLGKLDDFERKVFFRVVNRESSVCGKPHSLIYSVKHDRGCRKSHYAIRYVLRLVDGGYTDSEIEKALEERYRKVEIKTIDVVGAPLKGNPSAPVKIVEFVDYECPHCRMVQPVLKQLLDEFRNDLAIVLKHYPLGQHTNARLAATAGVAAHRQGKFWALSDRMWDNADALTRTMLEKLAREAGLDVEKFRKDLDDPEVAAQVQKDRDEGARLGLRSTPTLYINGQLYTDGRDVDSLRDWISEALGR